MNQLPAQSSIDESDFVVLPPVQSYMDVWLEGDPAKAKNSERDIPELVEITLDDCITAIETVKAEQTPADEVYPEKKSVIGYLHTGNAVDDFVLDVIDELATILDQKIRAKQERNEIVESEPLNIVQTKLFVLRELSRLLYIIEITDDDTLFQEKLTEYKKEAGQIATSSPSPSHPEIS